LLVIARAGRRAYGDYLSSQVKSSEVPSYLEPGTWLLGT